MPVDAYLRISTGKDEPIYRGLFLDYQPHLQLLEKLTSGKWREDYDPAVPFSPGEVPWRAFNFDETKKVLSDVNWKIVVTPNERDKLWEGFEALFKSK